MKLEYLREFLDLTETLNYSLSAGRLFLSQPTLSRHIQAMEKELGFSLVITSNHGIELTRAGTMAIPIFRKMIADYDRFLKQCRNYSPELSGSVRIGLLYYAMDDYLSEFMVYMAEKYPNADFSISSYQPQALYDDLLNGKIDVASLPCPGKPEDPDLIFQRTGITRLIAMMRNNHPLSASETITLQELAFSDLIELKKDTYSNELTQSILKKNHIYFRNILWSDNIETVPMTIRKTGGIHITGESCRRQNAAAICYKTITGTNTSADFGFLALRSNHNPLVRLILKEAAAYFH